ncbi:MAG: TRAP transporter small permease [Casimicrobiaceae bacterium]
MRNLLKAIAYIPELIAGVTMLAITGVLFAGVIWRYAFGDPLGWSDEVARVLFVWLAFIGAAIGVKRRLHASVSVLSSRMSPKWRFATSVFAMLLIAVMASLFVYTGAIETVTSFGQQSMPVTGLPTGWLYLAVPVSGALMLAYLFPQARHLFAHGHRVDAPAEHPSID